MEYFVCTIEECEKAFGIDKSLSRPKQISLLAKQKLISIIKEKGLSFDTTIAVAEKGKPYFLNQPSQQFSISHTKSHIAIAMHDKEIGVDIENLRAYKAALVARFFHPKESDYISNLPKEKQDEAFTRIWTLKEAFVKCTGQGIADNFKTFYVKLDLENAKSRIVEAELCFNLTKQSFKSPTSRYTLLSIKEKTSGLYTALCITEEE